MKVRVITGLVAAVLPLAALFFLQTHILAIVLVPFMAMVSYEICHVVKMKNKGIIIFSAIVAAMVPIVMEWDLLDLLRVPLWLPLLAYIFILVVMMLARFEETRFEHVLIALMASLGAPVAVSMIVMYRDFIKAREGAAYEQNLAVFLLFFAFCCAWLTDTFAYFTGSKLGKHKLAPKISPKKTWEGAIGGVVGTALANVGFAAIFNAVFLHGHQLRLLSIGLISVPICIVSMIGDMAASSLKRSYGAKDFGHLFPGHGGVMDRIDSLSYVAPFLFSLLQLENSMGLQIFYK